MRILATILLFVLYPFAQGQSFFTETTYVGAFGTDDWTLQWTDWAPRNTSYPTPTVTLQGNITTNTVLTANKTYLLKGYVYVKNNVTLTIEPGTIIRCDVLSASALIVTRGSKIFCDGTPTDPIVFTSSESTGFRTYGDWGGIVVLGNARINATGGTSDVGAGINNSNGDGVFGGNDDEDNSGSISYTRIEFAGVQYQPDKEISGLTLAGVGSQSTFHHIQISFCGNDGIHIAGGKARIKNLVLHRGYNTDISVDMGYRGYIQFAVVLRDSTKAGAKGASGIEIQNDALATGATPYTDPTFSNFTILGPLTTPNTPYNSNYRYAVHVKRNGRCALFNSAMAGYTKGLVFDGPGVGDQVKNGHVIFEFNTLAGNKSADIDTTNRFAQGFSGFDKNNWLLESAKENRLLVKPRDLNLQDPYTLDAPVFLPKTGSLLEAGSDFAHPRLANTELVHHAEGPQKIALFATPDGNVRLKIYEQATLETLEFYTLSGQLTYIHHYDGQTDILSMPAKGTVFWIAKSQNGTVLGNGKLLLP